MNKERLLNIAKALRESPAPEKFTMDAIVHSACNTPACALGHYAARTDLQAAFVLRPHVWGMYAADRGPASEFLRYDGPEVCKHFDITPTQACELFKDSEEDDDGNELPCGCGGAKTAIEAAEYIERFVERN
jgi:hypothetical protein